jgi:hypothetical protein
MGRGAKAEQRGPGCRHTRGDPGVVTEVPAPVGGAHVRHVVPALRSSTAVRASAAREGGASQQRSAAAGASKWGMVQGGVGQGGNAGQLWDLAEMERAWVQSFAQHLLASKHTAAAGRSPGRCRGAR